MSDWYNRGIHTSNLHAMQRLWLKVNGLLTLENAETLAELREVLAQKYAAPRFLVDGWNR